MGEACSLKVTDWMLSQTFFQEFTEVKNPSPIAADLSVQLHITSEPLRPSKCWSCRQASRPGDPLGSRSVKDACLHSWDLVLAALKEFLIAADHSIRTDSHAVPLLIHLGNCFGGLFQHPLIQKGCGHQLQAVPPEKRAFL